MRKLILLSDAAYRKLTEEEKEKICNGIGPKWLEKFPFGKTIIDILSSGWICFGASLYEPSCIHDNDYSKGVTPEDKARADRRFFFNMFLTVKFDMPFHWLIRPKFWKRFAVIWLFYKTVSEFGDKAFFEK